jgi:phosphate transport system permease protein
MPSSAKSDQPLPIKRRISSMAGEGKIWLCALGLALGLLMTLGLLTLIVFEGLVVFWPREVVKLTLAPKTDGAASEVIAGEIRKIQNRRNPAKPDQRTEEWLLFTGNKDVTSQSFRFVDASSVIAKEYPLDLMVAERIEYGDSLFYPVSLKLEDGRKMEATDARFDSELARILGEAEERRRKIGQIEKGQIGDINRKLAKLDLEAKGLIAAGGENTRLNEIIEKKKEWQVTYEKLALEAKNLRARQKTETLQYKLQDGKEGSQAVGEILHVMRPNSLSWFQKFRWFLFNAWEFISGEPREANTEGGIFPAIFGTFVMTLLMSVLVTPLGVIAAIYLREYAKQGMMVRAVRISVNNLAGVPSIVFGVFGLGFFVYTLGGSIDQLLFSSALPTPTFGTGGIFWAALTLSLLTLPVIIVAAEEALGAVPRGVREAALACGASKWQTIQRIVLPAAVPGILTGVVLAMARGAGEVAPLMLVGVVKLAPTLPLDSIYPFIHGERKFMHLGFHIFDLGFQSPDSEAAKPMVFATTLFLIAMVIALNLAAIVLRNKIRKKYAISAF